MTDVRPSEVPYSIAHKKKLCALKPNACYNQAVKVGGPFFCQSRPLLPFFPPAQPCVFLLNYLVCTQSNCPFLNRASLKSCASIRLPSKKRPVKAGMAVFAPCGVLNSTNTFPIKPFTGSCR
mmetsp:Transcript_49787/g.128096  ORF Transcript_49787/g.128096 Transcript_49787/m.128096 type:complete len:122 (-) Transcript_49787:1527-1892(-)